MTDGIETSINSIAIEVCKAEPNIEAATKKLRKKLLPRKDEIMEELYEAAIKRAVYVARGCIMGQVKRLASPSGSRVVAGAEDGSLAFNRGFLASWQTPDGRYLADVTGAELHAFAAMESAQAEGHAKVASFYETLAVMVGDARVGDAVSDDEAMKLWQGGKAKSKNNAKQPALPALQA